MQFEDAVTYSLDIIDAWRARFIGCRTRRHHAAERRIKSALPGHRRIDVSNGLP